MSLSMTLTRHVAGLRPTPMRSEAAVRRQVANRPAPAAVSRSLRRRCTIDRSVVEGFDVMTLHPRAVTADGTHLVYLHGGAYVSELLGPHWAIIDALMRRTPVTVTVPMYGLAPQHTIDDAVVFLDAVTAKLAAADPRRVVLAGDSAGGGLAVAYAQRQRDGGAGPDADAVVLFSPWVDVTMSNPEIAAIEPRDIMLTSAALRVCGTWWAGRHDTTNPLVSPLYGDLGGLPPITTFQGDHDLFLPDVRRMHDSISRAGGANSLTVAAGGFHVYVGATWTPEAATALDRTATVIAGNP
jgi:epsilon-lactone hydrolase